MVRIPAGIPVGTTAIGKAGAKNAALLAVAVLALSDRSLQGKLKAYRKQMRNEVEADDDEKAVYEESSGGNQPAAGRIFKNTIRRYVWLNVKK